MVGRLTDDCYTLRSNSISSIGMHSAQTCLRRASISITFRPAMVGAPHVMIATRLRINSGSHLFTARCQFQSRYGQPRLVGRMIVTRSVRTVVLIGILGSLSSQYTCLCLLSVVSSSPPLAASVNVMQASTGIGGQKSRLTNPRCPATGRDCFLLVFRCSRQDQRSVEHVQGRRFVGRVGRSRQVQQVVPAQ